MLLNEFLLFTIDASDKLVKFKDLFKKIPWWGYLIFLLLMAGVYIAYRFKKGSSSSSTDPITVRIPRLQVVPGNAQHIGARSDQQDSFGFSDINDDTIINQYGVLAVLADGMGGLSGGKEASHLAVQTFLTQYPLQPSSYSICEKLILAVNEANSSILTFAIQNGYEGRVGTTLIAATVYENQLFWLSIGDSRIYLYKNRNLLQLTKDHVYANELDAKAAIGEITVEQAQNDPQRESLTSFLGLPEIEELNVSEEPINLDKGDVIILCSDGLYGSVSTDEMMDICASFPAQEAAEKLIERALSKGKANQDNATVAILSIV